MKEIPPVLPVERPELKPIWNNPEGAAFLEWYEEERKKPEGEQALGYEKFLEAVKKGEARLPSTEALARHRIKDLRT